jgi:phospho-N-acetylmuramoyl-pentapeptide-transferase
VLSNVVAICSFAFIFSLSFYHLVRRFNIVKFVQPQRGFIAAAQEKAKYKPIPCGGIVFFFLFALYSIVNDNIDYKFFTIAGFFAIGLLDDIIKITKKSHTTFLTGRRRIILEVVICLFFAYNFLGGNSYLLMIKNFAIDIPFFVALPIIAFIIIGTANAVNLTDGQDALAGKMVLVNLFFILALFGFNCAILVLIFALLAFILFNSKPATIYMGDSGSLFLGSFLAVFFLNHKIEFLLPLTGIVFVLEACSVILQVYHFKLTNGKRIFKMSPLHHHFELSGLSEEKIVTLAFVITAVASLIAYYIMIGVV